MKFGRFWFWLYRPFGVRRDEDDDAEAALDRALEQNPDVLLSRLDQQKARDQILIARILFTRRFLAAEGMRGPTGIPPRSTEIHRRFFEAPRIWLCSTGRRVIKSRRPRRVARGSAIDVDEAAGGGGVSVASLVPGCGAGGAQFRRGAEADREFGEGEGIHGREGGGGARVADRIEAGGAGSEDGEAQGRRAGGEFDRRGNSAGAGAGIRARGIG